MLFYSILSIVLLNIIYLTGFFTLSILLNVTETHYFLGYNPKFIKFQIRHVTFNVGIYIPIVGLSPIYTLTDEGQRMKYPWEFGQYSLGKRFVATLGGAIALVVASVAIFIAQAYFTTESIITKAEINRHGIYPSEWGLKSGFLPGDKIMAVNGNDYQEFNDLINPKLLLAPEVSYTVVRDGKELQVIVRDISKNLTRKEEFFLSIRAPFKVLQVAPGSAAEQAGIKPGDRITKVNELPVIKFTEMTNALKADDDGEVSVTVERKTNDSLKAFTMDITLDYEQRIGIWPEELINFTERKNSLWQAIHKGTYRAFTTVQSNISAFTRVISGSVAPRESLSGPIAIANTPARSFWWITAFFAMWYAVWNLLPLPKSAFWEIIALAYEGLTKKKYPYTAFRRSLVLSWVIFGAFFIWIFVNDIIKMF